MQGSSKPDKAEPSVAELTQCLLAIGADNVLEWPLARVVASIEDGDVRELFEHLASDHRSYNLRSILRFNELDPWVARTCTQREAVLVRQQLQAWIEQAQRPTPNDRDARQRAWQAHAAPPELAALAKRLVEVVSRSRGASDPEPAFAREHEPRLDPKRAVVEARSCSDARQASQSSFGVFRCELSLQGFEHSALRARCDCDPNPHAGFHCCHVRALALHLLDVVHGQDGPLRRGLQNVCQTPSWVRFFAALGEPTEADPVEPSASKPSDEAQRLCFRLRLRADSSVGVSLAVQRLTRAGSYSRGARVTLGALQELPAALQSDPIDQLALGLLRAIPMDKAGEHTATVALLRVLIGHSALLSADGSQALALQEQSIELSFEERKADDAHGRGLWAGARLGDIEIGGLSAPPQADHFACQPDRNSARLLFAPMPEPLARWLWTLSHAPTLLPHDCHAQLRKRLRELQSHVALRLPPQLLGEPETQARKLLLRLENNPSEGIRVSLHSRPLLGGPAFTPGEGPSEVLGERDGKPCYALRDLAWERATVGELLDVLQLESARELSPLRYHIATQEASLALIERVARARHLLEIEWLTGHRPLQITKTIRRTDLKFKINSAERWYEARGHAELDSGAKVSLIALLEAARTGQRFVQVTANSYAALHDELRVLLERAADAVYTERDKLKLAASALPRLLELTELARIERAPEIDALVARMQQSDSDACALPEPIASQLRAYQREGARFLLRLASWANGGCLADEMGLGKTVQTLTVLSARKELGPALVIAPTSVGHNWCAEAARFVPELKLGLYRGERRARLRTGLGPGDVLVTSYELATADRKELAKLRFATLVLDEAHMLKNAGTERARAIAAFDADFRIALTGTPVENHLGELWSLMAQLNPALLGSFTQFRARFGLPIERYDDAERLSVLRQIVSPFILRRDKRTVAPELPARIEVTRAVALSPAERDLYDAAVADLRQRIEGRRRSDLDRVEMLAEITKLRRLACHPRLVVADWQLPSSKLRALLDLLTEILPHGHRALLFSQFVSHLQLIRSALAARGLDHLYLDGSTAAGERARLVNRWQAGETSLFLISLKAGGTGLNLSKADYVVHLDPWWNPAAEDQAADRAHRIGSDRPVTIVRLLAQDTVEEQVAALHHDKRELARALLQETGARKLPIDELARYLGLA